MASKILLTLLPAVSALLLTGTAGEVVVRRYPAAPPHNLVRNGSFLFGADHWHNAMDDRGKVEMVLDSERKKGVVRLNVVAPGMKFHQGLFQSIDVRDIMASLKPDEQATVVCTADCRREDLSGVGSCFGVSFISGGKRIAFAETPYVKGAHAWQRYKVVRELPRETEHLHVTATFSPKSFGRMLLDNVKLIIEVRSSAPDAVAAPVLVPEEEESRLQFLLPVHKQDVGWFFEPGEKATVFLGGAGAKPQLAVTDFYGNTLPVDVTIAEDGTVSFAVPTDKPGYFLLKSGSCTQPYVVTPDQSRLAFPANHFGCNFHLARISFRDGKRELDLARRAGIGWVRGGGIEWSGVNTKADEDRFLKGTERIYVYTQSTGMGILAMISYTAQYASTAPADQDFGVRSRVAPHWDKLEAYAERHARLRNTKYWELMNEPDAELFWKGTWENWQKGDDRAIIQDAVTYYKTAKKGILKATPNATFLYMGGTAAFPEGSTYRPFFKTTLDMGMADEFDIMNIHYSADIPELKQMLKPYGADTRPFWVTEIGFHSGSNSSERQQLLVDVVQQVEQLAAGAEKIFKYDFRNDGVTAYHEYNFGMIRRDFSPKPNYVGLSTMIGLLHDAVTAGPVNMVRRSSDGYVKAFAFDSKENGRVNALWVCDASRANVTVTSPETSLTVIDSMGNKTVYPVENGRVILSLDELPVFVKGRISGDAGDPHYPGEIVVRRYPMTPRPILKNGTMSEGSRHWNSSLGARGRISAVMDVERGKKVLSIQSVDPEGKGYGGMYQRVNLADIIGTLAPDETAYVTYTALCKRENIVGRGVNIGVDYYRKGVRTQWNETSYRAGTSGWSLQKVSRKIPVGTEELAVNCNFGPSSTGTFLMDDITLTIEIRKKETTR